MCCGSGAIKNDVWTAEDQHWFGERFRCVDEQIVAQFERGLIELTTRRARSSRRQHWNFWVVNEDVARLLSCWLHSGERAVAFARIRFSPTVQVKREVRSRGPCISLTPAVFSQNEMADAWLVRELI